MLLWHKSHRAKKMMEKRKHNTVPFFLRLTVPPQWDQEGNTVLTPPRIWGRIAVSAPKPKQLPCPRLLLWTHHSYAERTLHTGDAAHPSSGKARAIANCCLLQLCGFHTSLCVHEMLKLLNIQEKNSRNLWWIHWISQDRLENLEPKTGRHSPSQSLAPRPVPWLWCSAWWISAWQRPL